MKQEKVAILNRYTSLPIALDILARRQVTLLSPETWEDRNDAFYLERYREKKGLGMLVAICFTTRGETFHHWKVFSTGLSGVCIEFDKNQLLKAFPSSKGFRCESIHYKWIQTVTKNRPAVETWPFLKRKAFKDEGEFRIIYEDKKAHGFSKHVDIELNTIRKVTLSPWLPDEVAQSVTGLIKSIKRCEGIPVKRSSLIDNSRWKRAIER
jgi:hypothetical protein